MRWTRAADGVALIVAPRGDLRGRPATDRAGRCDPREKQLRGRGGHARVTGRQRVVREVENVTVARIVVRRTDAVRTALSFSPSNSTR